MNALSKNVWKQLSRLFPANDEQSQRAAGLFREYESQGCLNEPASTLLGLSLETTADFFRRAALMHSLESPILRRRDTRWMSEFDYTFVNVRAAGIPGKPGDFLSAALFLTTLRTQGIILAPVTRGESEDLHFLESHAVIREELVNTRALKAGMGAELQMAAFCEAAHMLGLVLGFDLDYRVDPFAAVVLNRPELFLWKKEGIIPRSEEEQDRLREEVRGRVAVVRKTGQAPQRGLFAAALEMTELEACTSEDGSGRAPLSLRLIPKTGTGLGEHRESAVSYWGRVFDLWRDRYGFDFLLLRGTRESEPQESAPAGTEPPETVPLPPEIPDRSLVRRAADAARKAGVRRNIGVAAEGRPFDVESFGVQGVDLIIENDEEDRADRTWFEQTFALDEKLRRVNLGRKLRFSVPLAVTPGNTESSSRRERALIRRFTARFLGAGPSRRPLLETMGAIEGAWGYQDSLKKNTVMGWMPDPAEARKGVCLENVARSYAEIMNSGERVDRHLDDRCAWWVIRSKQSLLVPIVSVENEDLLPPEPFNFDFSSYLKDDHFSTVLEFDFTEERGLLHLSASSHIAVAGIPYRSFRLYVIN